MRTLQIGNDIVHFDVVKDMHPRFAERVLSSSELAYYQSHSTPKTFLWIAWAAKETGFKLLKQKNNNLAFSPSRFIFDPESLALSYEGETIPMRFKITENYVHCFAATDEEHPVEKVATVNSMLESEAGEKDSSLSAPSRAVRLLAKKTLARLLGCGEDDIHIFKNASGIPLAEVHNRSYPLSLSHHGDYVAVALTAKAQH